MSDPLGVGLIGAGPWARMVTGPVLAAGPQNRVTGVWSRTGVATQISTMSRSSISEWSIVNRTRPVDTPARKARSGTPGTASTPSDRASTRRWSTSMPTTLNPASAAAHASETPT